MSNNKIILKRSSVSGKTPTADQLDYGELAINYADNGHLFFKSSDPNVGVVEFAGTCAKTISLSYDMNNLESLKYLLSKYSKDSEIVQRELERLGDLELSGSTVSGRGFSSTVSLGATSNQLGMVGLLADSNLTLDDTTHTLSLTKDNVVSALGYTPPEQDTTYSNFTAATDSTSGKPGLVPAPAVGDNKMFLRGDGKWATLTPVFDSEGNRISGYVRSVQLGNGGNGTISIEVTDGQGLAVTTGTSFAATAKSPGMVAIGDNITLNASTHAISLTKANVVSALGYMPLETGATYSAGDGISLDSATNTFSNSGVRSVVSTAKNAFEINTGGKKTTITISNVPSANQATMDAKGNVFIDTYALKSDVANISDVVDSINSSLSKYSPKNSPTFTGIPAAPTAAEGTDTTQIATTAFVQTAVKSFADTYASKTELNSISKNVSSNALAITAHTASIGNLRDLSNLTEKGLGVIDDIAKKAVAASEPDLSGFATLSGSTFTGSVTMPELTVTDRVKLPTIIEQDTEITENRTISNMSVSTHYVELGDDVTVTVDDDATWVIK